MSPFDGTLENVASKKTTDQRASAPLRAVRSLYAVAEALSVVQKEAAFHGDPLLRDTVKMLEAITSALATADEESVSYLRSGTKWARRKAPGGEAPRPELVRSLVALFGRADLDDVAKAKQAALELIVSAYAPHASLPELAAAIAEQLDGARFRGKAGDHELLAKYALQAAGMPEPEAGMAVHSAARPTNPKPNKRRRL